MALSFTEGSIGGDIERIDLDQLEAFYSGKPIAAALPPAGRTSQGSNGIAIAPKLTSDGNALLLINPHTSFYFRSEAAGDERRGPRTSMARRPGASSSSTRASTPTPAGCTRRAASITSTSSPRRSSGAARAIAIATARTAGRSAFGRSPSAIAPPTAASPRAASPPGAPTTGRSSASDDGRWIAFAMMNRPVEALQQSFVRTKASDLESFMRSRRSQGQQLEQHHLRRRQGRDRLPPSAVRAAPRRPLRLYQAGRRQRSAHRLARRCTRSASCPTSINPPNGWVVRTPTPGPIARPARTAPNPARFPKYMDMVGENFRGLHAAQLLTAAAAGRSRSCRPRPSTATSRASPS